MIKKSNGWCCELCGSLIIGNCNNDNGYVTHIDNCLVEDEQLNALLENNKRYANKLIESR